MTELAELRKLIEEVDYSDSGMTKINGEIKGEGFFPGADGMIEKNGVISDKKFMILGQDQDKEIGFKKSVKIGNEAYTPTWRNLKGLLSESSISLNDCFFTNCIIGARLNAMKNTGKSKAIFSSRFLAGSIRILTKQIEIQRPKGIICLGIIPVRLLSLLSDILHLNFVGVDNFREIDQNNLSLIEEVEFREIKGFTTSIACLNHPSYRNLNVKNREFEGYSGEFAELEILNKISIF